MNKEELVLRVLEMLLDGDSKEVIADTKKNKPLLGEYVIVRCRDAGVHAGILVDWEGREVQLKESKRLWYFKCKTGHSLSGVALHGITDESKIAGQINKVIILPEACEIIPAESVSERSIRDAKEYNS